MPFDIQKMHLLIDHFGGRTTFRIHFSFATAKSKSHAVTKDPEGIWQQAGSWLMDSHFQCFIKYNSKQLYGTELHCSLVSKDVKDQLCRNTIIWSKTTNVSHRMSWQLHYLAPSTAFHINTKGSIIYMPYTSLK